MFAAAWIFLKSPLGRKVALYGGVALAFFLWLRWQTNKAYENGVNDGKVKFIRELTEAKVKEWAEKDKEIEQSHQEVLQLQASLSDERKAVAASRVSLRADLAKSIGTLRDELNRNNAEIASVPASELDMRIRRELELLR